MKIILIKNVSGLGVKNDNLTVKSGYARNYLIPQGYAVIANYNYLKKISDYKKRKKIKDKILFNEYKTIIDKVRKINIKIKVHLIKDNKFHGSITPSDVLKVLSKKNIYLTKKSIKFKKPIKSLGNHVFTLFLHKKIKSIIPITIIPK